jgi:hypothetical protein
MGTQMNETSQRRVEWAKSVTTAYANRLDVQAIILGGSTARGVATEHDVLRLSNSDQYLPRSA